MSIQSSEIKYLKSANVSDGSSNGGRMSNNEIADNVKNALWPDVHEAERAAGSVKYRKVFIKIANDDDLTLVAPCIFVENPTPGDDRILIFPGTQTDTQGELASPRLYGCGHLDANVSAGATTLAVNTEAAVDAIFQNGDLIRISDRADLLDTSGHEEYLRLAASNAVSWNGDKATLTFAAGASLAYSYTAASTRVTSCIEPADIVSSISDWSESSASGTYNETTYPVLADNIGSVEDTWVITFTSATTFTCSGANTGSVGSGSTGSTFAPNNTAFSKPYFTLSSSGWGGAWASNDTVTFKTHPAATSIWEKHVVPAGADSITGNKVVVALTGASS